MDSVPRMFLWNIFTWRRILLTKESSRGEIMWSSAIRSSPCCNAVNKIFLLENSLLQQDLKGNDTFWVSYLWYYYIKYWLFECCQGLWLGQQLCSRLSIQKLTEVWPTKIPVHPRFPRMNLFLSIFVCGQKVGCMYSSLFSLVSEQLLLRLLTFN